MKGEIQNQKKIARTNADMENFFALATATLDLKVTLAFAEHAAIYLGLNIDVSVFTLPFERFGSR